MNLKNFLAELKRRNVYKVAVAYAVASIIADTEQQPFAVISKAFGAISKGFDLFQRVCPSRLKVYPSLQKV